MTASPEHPDCNRSLYLRAGAFGPVEELDPATARYASPVAEIEGREYRWWLIDVEEQAREHPATFFVPSLSQRTSLPVGAAAKLVFAFSPGNDEEPNAERMWVVVAGTNEAGYAGYLTNRPGYIRNLEEGALIAFEPHHVASVLVDEDEAGFNPDSLAFVSARLADGGSVPGYVVLGAADERFPAKVDAEGSERVDSGWQILMGDETRNEFEDATAVLLWPLGWVVDRFPQLLPLVRRDEPGEWEWNGSAYEPVGWL